MRFSDYLKDKAFSLIIGFLTLLLVTFLLVFLEVHLLLQLFIPVILLIGYFIVFFKDYFKRKNFYDYFSKNLASLDQKYLIGEMIGKPDLVEAAIWMDFLYDIDKNYHENLNNYKYAIEDFKDYIELWCHEIKTPIATSKLSLENKSKDINSYNEELTKIENYVEQVLYYARSENVEKDYIINKTSLNEVINNVVKRNKKDLISKKIKIETIEEEFFVESDSKWLEFIINQIVVNSVKYSKEKNPIIEFNVSKNNDNTILTIKDNGIGIKSEELPKVFNKGFTGTNGRMKYNSTGIGLYLCNKLCKKLHHEIFIDSKENEYTKISIVFPNSSLVEILH